MEKAKKFVKVVKAAVDAEREIERCPYCRPLLDQIKVHAENGHEFKQEFITD